MRRIIWLSFIGIIGLSTLVLAGGMGLAYAAPFQPGNGVLYAAQSWTEQVLAEMDLRPAGRALRLIDVANRRANTALQLAGTSRQQAAYLEMQSSFNLAVQAAAISPESEASILRPALVVLLRSVEQAISRLSSQAGIDPVQLAAFQAWETQVALQVQQPGSSLSMLTIGHAAAVAIAGGLVVTSTPTQPPAPTVTIEPRMVYFPPGSPGAVHAFFPLTGKHASLECAACHPGGAYAGTAKTCTACHSAQAPVNHYPGECAACHTTSGWLPAFFDHAVAGAVNCITCHTKDKPANHYNGQCSACHTTAAWLPAHFDHAVAGAVDCQSCHLKDKPANHYNGQCSACHNTSAWLPAHFNHAAAGATDCVSCHAGNAPANHWKAQCSACHNTSAWKPATFNHAAVGATDCISCHAGNRPANHFDGQCSQCHSTTTWAGATFNHSFPMNHGGANGVCAKCHPSGPPAYTCFTCHNQGEMDQKHSGIPNYASRCLECHPNGGGAGGGGGGGD